jgi:alpha-N-arabinofuranosidase
MILTDKEKMVVTPTGYVFELFVPHQDATLLPSELTCADYTLGNDRVPGLSVSVSRNQAGLIHLTLCNLNPNQPAELACELQGAAAKSVTGRVLTADAITAHNTFAQPDAVKPAAFNGARVTPTGLTITLPPKSVVALAVQP